MSYSIDTLETLIADLTGQCDLVRRRIMGFLGGAEIVRIKAELSREWQLERAAELAHELAETDHPDVDSDFYPFDITDDDYDIE